MQLDFYYLYILYRKSIFLLNKIYTIDHMCDKKVLYNDRYIFVPYVVNYVYAEPGM